jgi:hypothetical protein
MRVAASDVSAAALSRSASASRSWLSSSCSASAAAAVLLSSAARRSSCEVEVEVRQAKHKHARKVSHLRHARRGELGARGTRGATHLVAVVRGGCARGVRGGAALQLRNTSLELLVDPAQHRGAALKRVHVAPEHVQRGQHCVALALARHRFGLRGLRGLRDLRDLRGLRGPRSVRHLWRLRRLRGLRLSRRTHGPRGVVRRAGRCSARRSPGGSLAIN